MGDVLCSVNKCHCNLQDRLLTILGFSQSIKYWHNNTLISGRLLDLLEHVAYHNGQAADISNHINGFMHIIDFHLFDQSAQNELYSLLCVD
jgi:hypothetical protein